MGKKVDKELRLAIRLEEIKDEVIAEILNEGAVLEHDRQQAEQDDELKKAANKLLDEKDKDKKDSEADFEKFIADIKLEARFDQSLAIYKSIVGIVWGEGDE
jgi:hypothetical protein